MIPFIKPALPSPERYYDKIGQMYQSNWYSNGGPFVKQFEQELKTYLQTDRHIIVVSNATLGLILALKGLQITGKVLLPSFTFAATVAAVQWCDLDFEYVDINEGTWCIDPDIVEQKLKQEKYGAIMPVHALGNPCDIERFEELGRKHNVKIIFDAASAIGATYDNQRVGNFGDIEVFSLHATKCLPIGEGGFLSVKDIKVAKKIRTLMNFGLDYGTVNQNGINAKMPEILAIVGIEALKDLPQHMKNRREYVKQYKKQLGGMVYQVVGTKAEHGLQILNILHNNAEKVVEQMFERGIQVRRYYSPPLHCHPAYKHSITLPVTEKIASKVVSLPLHSIMDNHIIKTISKALREVINDC